MHACIGNSCVKKALSTEQMSVELGLLLVMQNGQSHPTLCYWCFAPGMAMQQLAALKIRSVLLTSGTLSPLDSFAYELQLPFPITLENPHVIDPSQVCPCDLTPGLLWTSRNRDCNG